MVGDTFVISGHVAQLVSDLLPLVDRADALYRALDDARNDLGRGRMPQGARHLIGRNELNVGLRREHALEEVGLQACEHCRHEDDDRHADRDGGYDEERLHPPFPQEAQGRDPFEWRPAVHDVRVVSTRALMRAPSLMAALTRQDQLALLEAAQDFGLSGADKPDRDGLTSCMPGIGFEHPWRRRCSCREGFPPARSVLTECLAVSISTDIVISWRK